MLYQYIIYILFYLSTPRGTYKIEQKKILFEKKKFINNQSYNVDEKFHINLD